MKYRWACAICGESRNFEERQFPIHHCGVRHVFPMGVISELPDLLNKRPVNTSPVDQATLAPCCPGSIALPISEEANSLITHPLPCEFSFIQGSQQQPYQRCIHCGFLLESGHIKNTPCSNPHHVKVNVPLPNIAIRFNNYAKSYAHYLATGQKQVDLPGLVERFTYCSTCEYYHDLEGACSVCGCYVNLSQDASMPNKLLWACESCPLKPPKWPSR